jgi:hypothetical protein
MHERGNAASWCARQTNRTGSARATTVSTPVRAVADESLSLDAHEFQEGELKLQEGKVRPRKALRRLHKLFPRFLRAQSQRPARFQALLGDQ